MAVAKCYISFGGSCLTEMCYFFLKQSFGHNLSHVGLSFWLDE